MTKSTDQETVDSRPAEPGASRQAWAWIGQIRSRLRRGLGLMGRAMALTLIILFLGLLLLCNVRLYDSPDLESSLRQLAFLESTLDDGAGDRMQDLFPEGFVFSWAIYGLACVQAAEQLPETDPRRATLLARAWRAVREVQSPHARSTFDPNLTPAYGAYYHGWSLYLRAVLLRAEGMDNWPNEEVQKFLEDCETLTLALRRHDHPFLDTYVREAWPADNVVGMAALGIHDQIFAPTYQELIGQWLDQVRERLDPSLGAISHAAHPDDGRPLQGVRGAGLALMSRLLVDVDSDFARDQYERWRKYFFGYRGGLPGGREYPVGVAGRGDVDSGPLVLGYSGPATVVGAAAARANGDDEVADALLSLSEAAGFPVTWRGQKRYLAGRVPVGDAFFAWAHTTPRAGFPSDQALLRLLPPNWKGRLHIASMILAVTILWVAWRKLGPRRKAGM